MIKISDIKGRKFHLTGCGGIGMLGLALMLSEKGAVISGSDIASGKNTSILEERGGKIFIGEHKTENLPGGADFILIYSSAVKDDNPELQAAADRKVKTYRRGEFLGMIAENFESVITVSGSHGKTTVTSMISFILKQAGLNPGYYIGGFIKTWRENASCGAGKILVAEADESDLSISRIKSDLAITLNLDNDHAWNVGGVEMLFEGFRQYASDSKYFLNASDKFPDGFLQKLRDNGVKFLRKGQGIEKSEECFAQTEMDNINAALLAAEFCGVKREEAIRVIKVFPGVERRMSVRFSSERLEVIEDYAHHPEEIKSFFSIMAKRYHDICKLVVFQPHREKRLRYCFDGFCAELSKADYVFIMPLFSAWEERSFSLEDKLSECLGRNKSEFVKSEGEAFFERILCKIKDKRAQKTAVIFMGAGDIDQAIKPFINYISGKV